MCQKLKKLLFYDVNQLICFVVKLIDSAHFFSPNKPLCPSSFDFWGTAFSCFSFFYPTIRQQFLLHGFYGLAPISALRSLCGLLANRPVIRED